MQMKARCWIAAVALGLSASLAVSAQEEVQIAGKVVDTAGKPVAGVEIATFWTVVKDKMQPNQGVATTAEGKFKLTFTSYGQSQGLLALDKVRTRGALLIVEPKDASKPVEIKLAPLVHVHGKFYCKELNKRPSWTNVYVGSGQARFLMCSSNEAAFSFRVPPGTYQFWGYGTDIQNVKKDLTLQADQKELDLQTIDMAATIIARHKGKAPPAWHVTDGRGVKKDVKLSDFKGKWVFVEFWGFW
jgi:hypothetical protein